MVQVDNDYTGNDFTASIKSLNPSFLEGGLTGIFIGSYMQSLTPGLAVGLEAIWQRSAMNTGPETAISYCGKYKGGYWIASATLQAQGAINTTYWRRLTDKVEAGVDLNLQIAAPRGGGGLMGGEIRKEGVATVGAKYDFRASTFRAQVDSTGKLSCLLEKRVAPAVQLTFAGDMDHFKVSHPAVGPLSDADFPKNQAKIGVAVSIEAASEEVMEQPESAAGPSTSSIPF
jgi:mitochondrial import receptor subunit TOM40